MMEVYKCLDDVITKVEKQEEIILKARHTHGQLAIHPCGDHRPCGGRPVSLVQRHYVMCACCHGSSSVVE